MAKDPSRNAVLVSNRYNDDKNDGDDDGGGEGEGSYSSAFDVARTEFYVEDIHWIGGVVPDLVLLGSDGGGGGGRRR